MTDFETPVIEVLCDEPEGQVIRRVRPLLFTPENLQKFWDKAKQFQTIYGREFDNVQDFYHMFIRQEPGGDLNLNGLFWVIDDFVGVFYMTDITLTEANVHYSFFDRRHKGRHNLVREMLKYVFSRYPFLRRVNVEIPGYATKYTRHFIIDVGFALEGRKRKAITYKGQVFDMFLFGILKEEVLNNGGT